MYKVVHLITGLNTGGAEMMLMKLLAEKSHNNIDNYVVSLMGMGTVGERIEDNGVTVYTLGLKRGIPSIKSIYKIKKIFNQIEPDLIQGWMYHGNVFALLSAQIFLNNVPVIWNIRHSLYDIRRERLLTRCLIKLSVHLSHYTSAVLYNSKISMKQHEKIGFKKSLSVMMPNGFDMRKFFPDAQVRGGLFKQLAIKCESYLVGSVARFHPMKDHKTFINAACYLLESRKDIHFILVGKGVCAESLNINQEYLEYFHFLGELEDVSNVIKALDVFVSSSQWGEGFPNVIGEAMACGVPCVVTDIGDSALIVGDCGLVVPPALPDVLANKIENILSLPINERLRMGAKARSRISDNFSIDKVRNSYFQLYTDLLEE